MKLQQISSPDHLRCIPSTDLPELAHSIREFLVSNVSLTGGHLGSNLGVVELTLAIHRVFESPRDAVVFDVGHQSYVHKILTGRQEFSQLRARGGLSGYPSRSESEHDVVENSHASSSLAWADGISRAWHIQGVADRSVVVVVGDGALTGGMSWEALNNLSEVQGRSVVVVLNDNGRSYDLTVGGLSQHLAELRAGTGRGAQQKGIFELLGLDYLGPIDGHDTAALEQTLAEAKSIGRPVVVHVVTEKGRGYAPALADAADRFHAVGVMDPDTGKPAGTGAQSEPTWTDIFAEEITLAARRRPDIVAITAAMSGPTGLTGFAQAFPERFIDVGIAEQHALTMAAGMAGSGLHPVVAIYSTFLNRAYDQLLMDIALHQAAVTLVLDRSGVTGPDGASHHGMWDLALMQTVPGLRVAAPRDAATLREELLEALAVHDAPTALRYGKGAVGPDIERVRRLPDGSDVLLEAADGAADVLVVAVGSTCRMALHAGSSLRGQGIGCTVIDPRWVLPVGPSLVALSSKHRLVVVVEEGIEGGGIEAGIRQQLAGTRSSTSLMTIALPKQFLPQGTRTEVLENAGLTAEAVVAGVIARWRILEEKAPVESTTTSRKEGPPE